MWLAVLSPGPHPTRRSASPWATVLAWTPDDRRRVDGPFAALPTGLTMVRDTFVAGGLRSAAPRCFTCLAPCPLPDVCAPWPPAPVREIGVAAPAAGRQVGRPEAGPGPATLAYVWLDDVEDTLDPPADEEVLVVPAGARTVLLTPLDRVADTMRLVDAGAPSAAPPVCAACGEVLPGACDGGGLCDPGRLRRARPRRGGHRRHVG